MTRTLAAGRVLTGTRHLFLAFSDPEACIDCGMDAENSAIATWTFVGPSKAYPMCFWCLELWDARGWLAAVEPQELTPIPA